MMITAVAMLLFASGAVVLIDESVEIDPATSSSIARSLEHAIEARGGEGEVHLRLFRGPTITLLKAESSTRTTGAELRRDPHTWGPQLALVAEALFPKLALKPDLRSPPAPVLVEEPTDRTWPIVLGGVSAASLAGAIAFGLMHRSTSREIESSILFDEDYERLSGRLEREAIAADVLFGVAAASATFAIVLLFAQGDSSD
jgi:hypothetical protein